VETGKIGVRAMSLIESKRSFYFKPVGILYLHRNGAHSLIRNQALSNHVHHSHLTIIIAL
jgi:hypothetical protein